MPSGNNGQTSVFRKSRMSLEYYDSIKEKVAQTRAREIKAAALINVSDVVRTGVQVNPEETMYVWHADIESWPATKDEKMSVAQQIAAKAVLEK